MNNKTLRLNKVLRELNISLDRAVEYLASRGINVEARPTTKINEEVYNLLKVGFGPTQTNQITKTEEPTNGYCHIHIVGEKSSGKTTLVKNLFSNNILENNNNLINAVFSKKHAVKLSISEIEDSELDSLDNIFGEKAGNIFIIYVSTIIDENLINERKIISTIKDKYPNSIIYLFIDNKIVKSFKAYLFKLTKGIRDVFYSSEHSKHDFSSIKYVLENAIINYSTNRLSSIESKIKSNLLHKRTTLDLGKSNLTSLLEIPELFDCTHLETLILSNEWAEFREGKWHREVSENSNGNNNIGMLPLEFEKLKNLKILIAGGDWNINKKNWISWRIFDISPLMNLTKLEYINISNNLIYKIPNLSKLDNLKVLHLNNNDIHKVYKYLKISNLKEIYLSNNNLQSISFLKDSPNITTIDIHANKIKDLEHIKVIIEKINITNSKWEKYTINVAKNPLAKPPLEIVNIGKKAVLNYFNELASGRKYINTDVKLILIGNSEVGKTTLAKYLDNEKELDIDHIPTNWLEEREIISKDIVDSINKKCTINLFDFGGHDYFHDTHHLFYNSNTIYLLLWDKNSNKLDLRNILQKNKKGESLETEIQDYPLKYWLDSVKHYIKDDETETFDFEINKSDEYNSDVLVIQNKVESTKDIVCLNNKKLKKLYPFIYDFINISIKNNRRNLTYFDSVFKEILNNTSIIGAQLPAYYGKVKNSLKNYNDDPILNIKKFQSYCSSFTKVAITLDQTRYLANYLKQVGLILYYPSSPGNNEEIYIDKSWVLNKIHQILEGLTLKKGEFEMGYLDDIFKNSISKSAKESIIKLMIDFKMIFQHPVSDKYIAPLYLPLKPIKILSLFIEDNEKPFRRFIYKGFIHKNVILNLFQEYGKFVIKDNSSGRDFYYYWRDGLIIKDTISNEVVKIQFHLGDNEGNAYIDVFKLNNKNQTDFVNRLIQYIHEINKDYDIEETVTTDGIDYISYELLNTYAKEGKLIFTEKSLNDNKANRIEPKVFELKNYNMFIEGGIKRKKVVISYSKKDLVRVHTFRRYLKPLVDLELIDKPWYCTLLNPADEWDDKIQEKFNDADIIFFMVSEYFYSTQYIVEKEIKQAIDRYDNDKSVKIVPVILEHYSWGRKNPYNLQRFSALPFQAKPISDFKNEKIAWNTITSSVKAMIEKDLDPAEKDLISRDMQEIYERQVEGKLDNNSN
ncbi:COR domain-containing protein [Flavicella sediminum]|uniref:COR domain-containing protein n=1 Tax=Flavicella sediminum TaxID=2585141 RepID=UPI00111DB178|nr:COR domain-containing protein [Flavicella sediminum]